jgi:A/G-specific adenine glycosylase
MLQQTRASVVIPYFDRWMQLFPSVNVLAVASLQEIIKAWEGLGYYSRARHLHEGARQIVSRFDGFIPSQRENLETIKGLGPYMVNAILAFAFHQRAAAVDSNVIRVLTRHFMVGGNVAKTETKKQIQTLALDILDEKKPWVTAEALIELGATICQGRPLCSLCPFNKTCCALKENRTEQFPVRVREKPPLLLTRSVAVIEESGSVLIKKIPSGQLMADLYEFPYFEGLDKPLPQHIMSIWGLSTSFVRSLPFVQHSFTRYQARLFPIHLRAAERKTIKEYCWVSIEVIADLPFSAGHRRVLEHFLKRIDLQLLLF